MATRIVSELPFDLLPIICTCQDCHAKIEATEYSDFKYGFIGSGMDNQETDEIYTRCLACGDYAFPPESKKGALISAFELWKRTKPAQYPIWEKKIHCLACNTTSLITRDNLRVRNNAIAHDGESWDPEVVIECPVCETEYSSTKIPRGIVGNLIQSATKKRSKK